MDCFGLDAFVVEQIEPEQGILRGRFFPGKCGGSIALAFDGELHLGTDLEAGADIVALEPGCYGVALTYAEVDDGLCEVLGVTLFSNVESEIVYVSFDELFPPGDGPLPAPAAVLASGRTRCEPLDPGVECSPDNPDTHVDLEFVGIRGDLLAYLPYLGFAEVEFDFGVGSFELRSLEGTTCESTDDLPKVGWSARRFAEQ